MGSNERVHQEVRRFLGLWLGRLGHLMLGLTGWLLLSMSSTILKGCMGILPETWRDRGVLHFSLRRMS